MKKFLSILMIYILILSVCSSCTATENISEDQTNSNTEETLQTSSAAEEKTQAPSTEIYDDNTIYVSYSENDLGRSGINIADQGFDVLSYHRIISATTKEIIKNNIPNQKFTQGDLTFDMEYRGTVVQENSPSQNKYCSYDSYKATTGKATYALYQDGTLRNFCSVTILEADTNHKINREKTQEVALDFIKEWFPSCDLDQYEVDVDEYDSNLGKYVVFKRYIHGYQTGDYAMVTMTYDGQVYNFAGEMFGSLEQFDYITQEQLDATKTRLLRSVSALVRTPDKDSIRLSVGDDGNLYMQVSATGMAFGEDGMWDETIGMVAETYYARVNP